MFTFYFPRDDDLPLPGNVADFTVWFEERSRGAAKLGPAAWILQTFLQLQARGAPCTLTHAWPERGTVIAHRDQLPDDWPQRADRYVVCCLADKDLPHPCANIHILQNPYQRVRLGAHLYLPHWPQPGLVPRDRRRGVLFEHIAFFGEPDNLAPELREPSFAAWCGAHGLRFTIPARDAWACYTDVDAVIAVRRFSTEWVAYDKPATKLFNAWLAGVVPILGKEAAYAAEGLHGDNCLVVSDLPTLKARLLELRVEPARVEAILRTGARAAQKRSHSAVAELWMQALSQTIAPRARRWQQLGGAFARPATGWARVKAGLAWRDLLLAHRLPGTLP